jgi:hypothetical protein
MNDNMSHPFLTSDLLQPSNGHLPSLCGLPVGCRVDCLCALGVRPGARRWNKVLEHGVLLGDALAGVGDARMWVAQTAVCLIEPALALAVADIVLSIRDLERVKSNQANHHYEPWNLFHRHFTRRSLSSAREGRPRQRHHRHHSPPSSHSLIGPSTTPNTLTNSAPTTPRKYTRPYR